MTYSAVLTPEEEQIGFCKAYVSNPEGHYVGHKSLVPAVVCSLSPGDQIIKLDGPPIGVVYTRLQHGKHGAVTRFMGGNNKLPVEWLPVFSSPGSPQMAVRAARSGSPLPGFVEVIISPPSLALRCPKCSHGFELAVDHIAVDARQSCPECKTEDDVAEFNAANV